MNEQKLPTIDIIFPLRNRAWILDHFLSNLYELDYPKYLISFIVYINDSTDNSEQILKKFKNDHINEYKKFDIYCYNLKTPEYNNKEGIRGASEIVCNPMYGNKNMGIIKSKNTACQVYKSLSKLRNHLLNKTASDIIFSIDTDILCNKDTLIRLVEHIQNGYDMVSCHICNGFEVHKKDPKKYPNPYFFTNIMKRNEDNSFIHIANYNDKGLIQVGLTGAISCMSKKLVKSGAKYYDISMKIHGQDVHWGEDAGFCESAQKLGFKIYCDCGIKLPHIMNEELLEKYFKGEFKF